MKEHPEIMTNRQSSLLFVSLLTVAVVIVFIVGITTSHVKTSRDWTAAIIVLALAAFLAVSTLRFARKK